jgi:hypothetical protein
MGGDWFAERRGSGTTRLNNPGQWGVTSDPGLHGWERESNKSAKHASKWLLQKKQEREDNRYPPEPETDPGEEENRPIRQLQQDKCIWRHMMPVKANIE